MTTGVLLSDSIHKVSATEGLRSSTLNGAQAVTAPGSLGTPPGATPSARQWVAASMRLAADLSALEARDDEPAGGPTR